MAKKHLDQKVAIFDFDGTLADVEPLIIKLYGEIAVSKKWPELTKDAYVSLRKGTIRQAMHWVGVKPWQLPGLMKQGKKLFHEHSGSVKLFKGITELIASLEKDGWRLYILSNNSVVTIQEVLTRNKIDQKFQILKSPSLFGKASRIKDLVGAQGYNKNNVWMIGDEVRDIEGARKAGVNSIGVSWGLQDEILLKATRPTHLVHTVPELKLILKKEKSNG